MSAIITFVSSDPEKPVGDRHVQEAIRVFDHYNLVLTCSPIWLAPGKAVDLGLSEKPNSALMLQLMSFLEKTEIDVFVSNPDRRFKRLVLADMDSTIVTSETLDELAEYAGVKDQIAAITAQAMEGKLDFAGALRERVGLLKDLPIEALHKTLARIQLSPGAESFIKTMKRNGAKCVLVSGGFTFFTEAVKQMVGFDAHHGNRLQIEKGKLNGKVQEPILDKSAKTDYLRTYIRDMKIKPDESLAIGDGANDIPMLKAAGLGIGYHPKEAVKKEIDNLILYGDMTAALYAQGFKPDEIIPGR